jgi:MFS transporter, putative metabolite:H+ symporter
VKALRLDVRAVRDVVGAFLADRVERKNELIGAAVAAAVIGWLYSQSSGLAPATLWGFLLFTCTYLMVALGLAAYIPELFTTENRMRGSGVASAAGTIAPQIVVAVYVGSKVGNVLAVVIGALISMALVLLLLGITATWSTGGRFLRRQIDADPSGATFCPKGR